jgi:hypothetical protein
LNEKDCFVNREVNVYTRGKVPFDE